MQRLNKEVSVSIQQACLRKKKHQLQWDFSELSSLDFRSFAKRISINKQVSLASSLIVWSFATVFLVDEDSYSYYKVY